MRRSFLRLLVVRPKTTAPDSSFDLFGARPCRCAHGVSPLP
jgi:hypothetical protein